MYADHHFTTAYGPWANGTVDVVDQTILHCQKALLYDLKLVEYQWLVILPLVLSAINHIPVSRLGMMQPSTAFIQC